MHNKKAGVILLFQVNSTSLAGGLPHIILADEWL